MQISKFTSQLNKQGIARANRWLVRIYPPSGLSATNKAISNILSKGGSDINISLPSLDAADAVVDVLNNASIDIGGVNIGANFNIPTLGYVLTNMGSKNEALSLFCQSCQLPARDLSNLEFGEYGEKRSLGVKHTHDGFTTSYLCSEDLREKLFFEQWQNIAFDPITKRHSYYNEYISRVEVFKYNASWSKVKAAYQFNECYPSNVGSLELNQENTPLELTIQWKYRNYKKIT